MTNVSSSKLCEICKTEPCACEISERDYEEGCGYCDGDGWLTARIFEARCGKPAVAITIAAISERDYEEGCGYCDGDGWLTAPCFEDTCCCADPEEEHGIIPCPNCNPE